MFVPSSLLGISAKVNDERTNKNIIHAFEEKSNDMLLFFDKNDILMANIRKRYDSFEGLH